MYSSSNLDVKIKGFEEETDEDKKRKQKAERIDKKINSIEGSVDLFSSIDSLLFPFIFLFAVIGALFLVRKTGEDLGLAVGLSVIAGVCMGWLCQNILVTKKQRIKQLKDLFYELAETPYECRMEWVKGENKIKVVVEENVVMDTGLVIKEKSRHLTAYLDMSEKEKLAVMIATLVKKAEAQFK